MACSRRSQLPSCEDTPVDLWKDPLARDQGLLPTVSGMRSFLPAAVYVSEPSGRWISQPCSKLQMAACLVNVPISASQGSLTKNHWAMALSNFWPIETVWNNVFIILLIYLFLFKNFLWLHPATRQVWNPWPLQWKHRVLITGPQGSPKCLSF